MLYVGKSDIGKHRSENQDTFVALKLCQNLVLCVICDGMGGVNGGRIASELAITAFVDYAKDAFMPFLNLTTDLFDYDAMLMSGVDMSEILIKATSAANITIRQRSAFERKLEGMGTTLIAAVFIDDILYIANVGDSRLYVLKENFEQITHDNSVIQHLIDIGRISSAEEASKSPYRNMLSRAVGAEDTIETDIYMLDFQFGTVLMCSDGLYNFMGINDFIPQIEESDDIEKLELAADKLIEEANLGGGGDNITVVLVRKAKEG
ncbi:MAG: protein phosphatase 2C domain-containing protein [Oscillospiraceae bacterium]|nr:protein phosphatase 2C domain-containing protein [Oscillospiraceae bacterium]